MKPGTLGWSQTGRSDGSRSTVEVVVTLEEGGDRAARSRPARSCRSSRRATPSGLSALGRGVEDRGLRARRAPRGRAGLLAPADVGARGERAEVRARRVDEHAVERARLVRGRRRRRCGPRRSSRPSARRCAGARRRGPRGARRPRSGPRRAISAARWVVLPPGAAHRSSTRSPGCGSSARATAIAARDCGMNRPCSHSGEANASNGASRTRPSGRPVGGRASATGRRCCERLRASCAACWPAARPRRARCRPPSARGRSRGRARRTTARRSTADSECLSAASAGVASGSALDERLRLAGGAAQHGVDEPAAAASSPWPARPTRRPPRGRGRGRGRRAGTRRAAARRRRRARAARPGGRRACAITWSSVARRCTAP